MDKSSKGNFGIFLSQISRDMWRKLQHIFGYDKSIPMMYFKDIDLINEIIDKVQPKRCLEWGSGLSTIYFPKRLSEPYEWVAVEHFEPWYKKVNERNNDPNVKLHFVPPNNEKYTDEHNDGSYEDFKDYVEKPEGKFDYIFVDGRARCACINKAHDLLNEDGVLLLHDANREYYHDCFGKYTHNFFLEDKRKKGVAGIWIATKGRGIDKLIDTEKHRGIWELHEKLHYLIKGKRK
ncbi:MAG: hypothetical protein ABJH05_07025 [Fulvivirga sp.]